MTDTSKLRLIIKSIECFLRACWCALRSWHWRHDRGWLWSYFFCLFLQLYRMSIHSDTAYKSITMLNMFHRRPKHNHNYLDRHTDIVDFYTVHNTFGFIFTWYRSRAPKTCELKEQNLLFHLSHYCIWTILPLQVSLGYILDHSTPALLYPDIVYIISSTVQSIGLFLFMDRISTTIHTEFHGWPVC